MDRNVAQTIEHKIAELYSEATTLLLNAEYYSHQVKPNSINKYLSFIELALQKPYNRLANLAAFLKDEDGLMSSRMYPIAFLKKEAKEQINQLFQQAAQLAKCLDALESGQAYQILEKEPHEV